MPHSATVRLATEHDLEALVQLEEAAFRSDRFSEDSINYLLTRSRATTLVIEENGVVVGSACVLWRRSYQAARLYNIAINPNRQGKGYGAVLMDECELEAARRGCAVMTLEVRKDNVGAIKFYERRGYVFKRMLPEYYEDGSAGLKMAKVLDLEVPDKIKLTVPYHAQMMDFTCGPACLMMALKYFNPDTDFSEALELRLWKEATLIFMAAGFGGAEGYGLALAAASRGLQCHRVTSMDTTPMLRSVRAASKREVMKIVHTDMKKRAFKAGVSAAMYEYGVDEIVSGLHRGLLPIAMISTYRLTGDKTPHWVVVTGFDRDHVYIHDSDLDSYKTSTYKARNIKVKRSEFLRMSRYGKEVYRCLLLLGRPT